MDKAELKALVLGAVFEEDGKKKLSCPSAFKIAEESGARLPDIGAICDEDEIRITKCQLGCFQ